MARFEMLAFRIEVDGEPFVMAGVEDWSTLSFAVVAGRRIAGRDDADDLHVALGGMAGAGRDAPLDHVRWRRIEPTLGSRISLEIVETDQADPPIDRFGADAEPHRVAFTDAEWREKRHAEYLKLKAEFEPDAAWPPG